MGLDTLETAEANSVKKIRSERRRTGWGGQKISVWKAYHMGSKWSSRSSDSSPSWSSPTPRYAAGAFRGLDRHTKSQPSYEHRTRHRHQTVCSWLSIQSKAAPAMSLLLRDYAYPCATWNVSPKLGIKTPYSVLKALGILVNSMEQHRAKASMKDK